MARTSRLVTGKFVTYTVDGPDAGTIPDEVPVVGLVVQLTPSVDKVSELAVPQTAFLRSYTGTTNSSGVLISEDGSTGLRVPVTSPENFTYDVLIAPPDGSYSKPYHFRVLIPASASSFDLTTAIPAPGDPGQDFSEWLSILTPIENLRDQVLEIAQEVEVSRAAAEIASATVNDRLLRFGGNNNGVYIPSGLASLRLRSCRNSVARGAKQGHIAFLGDSIAFGAGGSGTTPPKNDTSYPGRVRSVLAQRFGASGTGWTLANHVLLANPTWDSHLKFIGDVTSAGLGMHKTGAVRVNAVAGTYVEYTAYCDEFWVWNLSATGAVNTASINNVNVGAFRQTKGATGNPATLPMEPDYGGGQIVTRIAAPNLGNHTLRLHPDARYDDRDLMLVGIEGRITKPGTWRVTNASMSGKSMATLFAGAGNDDVVNELFGLGMVDTLRADILFVALHTNDWHTGATKAQIKDRLRTLVQRQRSTGSTSASVPGKHAGGDAVLVFAPQPSINGAGLPAYAGGEGAVTPWGDVRAAFYEVADEEDVVLIDAGTRWDSFARGWSAGLFGDPLHPNDAGSVDLADGVIQALFEVI